MGAIRTGRKHSQKQNKIILSFQQFSGLLSHLISHGQFIYLRTLYSGWEGENKAAKCLALPELLPVLTSMQPVPVWRWCASPHDPWGLKVWSQPGKLSGEALGILG